MKKVINYLMAAVITIGCITSAKAQDEGVKFKHFEHNFYLGSGCYISTDPKYDGNADFGFSVKLGYGLNYYFCEHISLMAGVSRHTDAQPFVGDGGDGDYFQFVDFPIVFQAHLNDESGRGKWMLGVGPVFGVCTHRDVYYIDYPNGPDSKLNNQVKIKKTNVSLMPCVAYEWKHWRLGVEGSIGLKDVKETHNIAKGQKHIHNVCAVIAFKF